MKVKLSAILIVFFSLVMSGKINAQQHVQGIEGTIRDAVTLVPLENVNIVLEGTSRGTITDAEGRFLITGLEPGPCRIGVTRIGYESLYKNLTVKPGAATKLTLYLQPEPIPIDSVGIVGWKPSRDLMSRPTLEPRGLEPAGSVITPREIRKQGAATVIDAMKFIPGGLTETRGRKVKQFFSVRGQKYPYPDYAVNGIWQKEFHELPYFFSSSDIERIEIVRSSAALLTGLSGLSGVIKLETRRYDSMETALQVDYGSFETLHGHLSHGGKTGKFRYAGGFGYDRTSGPRGKHAAENMINASGRIRWDPLPSLSIRANLFHLNGRRELRIAELPADQRFIDRVQTYDRIRSTMANVKTCFRPAGWASSELQLFYTGRKPVFIDETTEISMKEYDFEWGLNFIQALSLSSANTLRVGGLYNHWLAPNGKRFYMGRCCDTETFSLVAADEHKMGAAILDAGFRWTRTFMNEYGAFNIEGSGSRFTHVDPIVNQWQAPVMQGSLGITYNMNSLLSAHVHAGFGQLKPREGTLDTSLNVPASETRIKLDLGLIRDWKGGGRLVLAPFLVKRLNAIEYSGDTYQHPVTGLIMELYENREQDQFGVELEIRTPRLLNLFSAFYNISLMNSGIWKEGERTTNREHPALITNGGIYLEKWGFDLNIFTKYVSAFENERFASPADGPQPLGDFFTLDITGGYAFGKRKTMRIYLNIINVTDNRYSTVVGYPDYGRRISLGIRMVI